MVCFVLSIPVIKSLILGGFACSWPKFLEEFRSRKHGRGKETLWSSGWTLIGSELSSSNFNSSIRAEQSFAIRYLNVVIKPLCGNLDIWLNYYFLSQNFLRVLSVANRDRKWKMLFFGRALALFTKFCDRNPFRLREIQASGYTYWLDSLHALALDIFCELVTWRYYAITPLRIAVMKRTFLRTHHLRVTNLNRAPY